MAIVSDIEIRLRADIARLQTDMTAARRTVENSTNAMSAAVEKFKSALGGIAVGAIFAKFQADLISAQREFDKLNASLITATGSIGNAKQAFAALQGFAATTPYDLKQVTEGFLKLRNLGLDPSERALKSYGNTAGAMGKSLNQMVEAVADAATGEFERLKEFGIKAKQNGDFVTLTFQGVTTKIGNNAKDIEKYLMKIGEVNFAGGMELQARTLDGAISNLGDAWDSTLRTFSQAGFGDSAMAKTLALTNALTDLQAVFMATSLAAKEEGKAVSENSVLHKALTTIFETLAVMGEQVGFVMRSIGREIGALVAGAATFFSGFGGGLNALGRAVDGLFKGGFGDSKAVAQGFSDALDSVTGSFKGMLAISEEVTRQGEEDRQMTDARVEKILWAAAVAQKVRDNEAEAKERDGLDDLARYKVLGDGKKAQTAAEKKAAEDALSWYKKTKEAAEDKISLLGTELGASDALTDGQKKAIAVLGDLVKFSGNLTAEQKRRIALLTEEELRLERLTEARKADKKAQEEAEAAARKDTDTAWDKVRSLQEQVKTYGLTETAVLQLQAAEYQRQAGAAELSEVEQQRLSMLLAATQEQIALQTKLDKMKATTTFWTSMESAAHDMFMSIDKGNANLWQRMKDSAKNMFFEWLYQMTLKKWIIQIGTAFSGTSGVSGIANAADALSGGAGAGGGGVTGLINAGKTIYDGFATGFAGTGSALGGYVTSLGNLFGSSATSAFGAGMGMTSAQAAEAAAAYNSAGMASTGSALTSGSAVGAGAGIFAGAAGGYLGGNLISGQYGSKNTVAAGTAIGAAIGSIVPVVGTALGALIGGLLGGVANRLFGMGEKKVQSTMIEGSLTATGATGSNISKWTQAGGWFRSDKSGTDVTALSSEQSAAFSSTYKAILDVSKVLGDTIGADTAALSTRVQALRIDLTGLGTDAEKLGAVTKFFEGVADSIATELVPNLKDFQKEGESLSATMQRVVVDYATVKDALTAIGKTLGVAGAAGVTATEGLIKAAGGLDKLSSGLSYFQQNFLTDAERLAPVQKQLADAMASLGFASVTTKEQFKAAALSIPLTTQAGQELFAKMIALAPAFKAVTDASEAATKAAADLAAQQAAAAAAAAQAAAEAKAKALADNETLLRGQVSSALDQLKTAVDARKESLKSSFDDLMASLSASIDSWGVKITNLKSLSSLLAGAKVGAAQNAASRETAQAQIEAALAIAKASGVLPSADSLKDAIGAVTADSSNQFATIIEYQRDQARASRSIAGLAGLTDDQLTTAEKTLQVLQNQKASADAAYTRQISALDAIVTAGEKAAGIALGTYQATLSVDAGIATVAAAIAALKLGATTSNPTGMGMTVADLYTQVLGRAPDAGGLAFWQKVFGDTVDSSEYAQFIAGAAPELAAKASGTWAQWLAAHGAANTIPSGQGSDMQTALDTFNAQVSGMQAALDRTAKSTQQLADQFNAVSAGGNALLTESA